MEVTLKVRLSPLWIWPRECFNPCFNGSDSKRKSAKKNSLSELCFNPCFNGSDSKRVKERMEMIGMIGFNPCFNGSDSKSRKHWRVCR